MSRQIILAVDDQGQFLGYIPKEEGHKGAGRRHLAIAVILENSKGQILLQKRKHQIFDNIWDITAATHPLHKEDGRNESLEEAGERCLKDEWGITEKINFTNKGFFNYSALDAENSENEHCALLTGSYDGQVKLNPKIGYEYKWIDKNEFLRDIAQSPQKYTPWAKEGAKLLASF